MLVQKYDQIAQLFSLEDANQHVFGFVFAGSWSNGDEFQIATRPSLDTEIGVGTVFATVTADNE